MEQPKKTNRMTHFDSGRPMPTTGWAEASAAATSRMPFSDRVQMAMESGSDTEGERKPAKQVESEAPGDSDGEEPGGDKKPGGEGPSGDEEKTAPEPKEKTPAEMNESPADAVFGDKPSPEKEEQFGPENEPSEGDKHELA